MGIPEGGERLPAVGKTGQRPEQRGQPPAQQEEGLAVQYQIAVVGDIAAGSAEVQDARGGGSGLAVSIDMGHDVVADLFLALLGAGKINIGQMRLQVIDLSVSNGETERMLGTGKLEPEPAPGLDSLLHGKERCHLLRCIAGHKGRFVDI